jgi:hypothetical protein
MLPSSDNTRDPVSPREGLRICASAYTITLINFLLVIFRIYQDCKKIFIYKNGSH